MKGMWVGYDVGCTMGLTLGLGARQIDQPSNGSMWNSYSSQPVGQWMGYSFTDLGAEGCCRSLNALFLFHGRSIVTVCWSTGPSAWILTHGAARASWHWVRTHAASWCLWYYISIIMPSIGVRGNQRRNSPTLSSIGLCLKVCIAI